MLFRLGRAEACVGGLGAYAVAPIRFASACAGFEPHSGSDRHEVPSGTKVHRTIEALQLTRIGSGRMKVGFPPFNFPHAGVGLILMLPFGS